MSKKAVAFSLVILLLIWEAASLIVDSPLLPRPCLVIINFFSDLPHDLGRHILASTWRIVISMLLATAIGLPLGLMLGQNRRLDKFAYPLVYTTYPIPKIVLLPILILFLGIGDTSKVFLITLILFFQVLVIVRDASRNIPSELILSLRSLGANRKQMLRFVYFPACLPATITSLRLNVAIAIAVLYLAESFATASGLGYYIMDKWQQLSYTDMYVGILAMSLIGALSFVVLDILEKRVCRWTQAGKELVPV